MHLHTTALLLTLATPLMAAEPIWIDVRTPQEYRQDHYPGAVLIPHTRIARGVTERFSDRNTPIRLYGEDGRRSRMALEALQALGYRQVEDAGALELLRGRSPEPAAVAAPASPLSAPE